MALTMLQSVPTMTSSYPAVAQSCLKNSQAGLTFLSRSGRANKSRRQKYCIVASWHVDRDLRFHPMEGAMRMRWVPIRSKQERISALEKDDGLMSLSSEVEELAAKSEEILTRGQILWRAAKLPIYSVAVIPLTVASAVAYSQTKTFIASRYWLMFGSSLLIILWLNLSNDVFDSHTGVDVRKKESVINLFGSRAAVLFVAFSSLFAGFEGLFVGAKQANDFRVAILLAAAIGCGYAYQCPPFRLSYKGLGEPLCFFAFGPFATTAFYLSQKHPSGVTALPITLRILGTSVLVGITTALILFCSHFHQIEGDSAAGKMSPLVRLGTQTASKVVQAVVIGLYSLVLVLTQLKALPLACTGLTFLTLPIGKLLLDFIRNNHTNKEVIFMAKYFAVRLHVAFGLALALGFCVGA